MKEPVPALRAVVADPPSEPATLTLYTEDIAAASIVLEPTDALRLASELLNIVRSRLPRPNTGCQKFRKLKTTPAEWSSRHERLAQALARELTLAQASIHAGWGGDKSNCHRIAHRPNVQARLQAIRAELAELAFRAGLAPLERRRRDRANDAPAVPSTESTEAR